MLALPLQTAAHTGHIGGEPPFDLSELINWVQVYKNPLTVPTKDLTPAGTTGSASVLTASGTPLFDFTEQGLKGGSGTGGLRLNRRYTYINPSYHNMPSEELFWVKFDGESGELFQDKTKPGNSGLVTSTENTSVTVGDIVAIAVNVKTWGGYCVSDMAIGPPTPKGYMTGGGVSSDAHRNEGKWRLNPNLPIAHYTSSGLFQVNPVLDARLSHTLVYQFTVGEEHVILNAEGPWIKQRFVTEHFDVADTDVDAAGFHQWTGIDWIYGQLKAARPSDTTVTPFNTFSATDRFLVNWEISISTGGSGWREQLIAASQGNPNPLGNPYYNHRHVPMFDPANPPDPETGGHIFYPKIALPHTRATTEIVNVPEDPQTGAFTVTLQFSESSAGVRLFENHDTSADSVKTFKDKLATELAKAEDADWTVAALAYVADSVVIAASNPDSRPHSSATAYTLTLLPPLGVKGTFPLEIPADVVMDTDAEPMGNIASESVTVSVDTELRVAAGKAVEIAAPAAGAYLADDVIEVLVPFAQDGLTYAGDNPPYLTIYLGEAARHATWQQGEESAGSTIVPFRYTIDAADPIAESVRVGDEGLSIPKGTTLMNGAGLSRVGTDPMPKASGESPEPSPAKPMAERLQILTPEGNPLPTSQTESQVTVLPTPPVYLPPEESESKAGMSSVPRSPIVFNELGNGSCAENDWLELRNVTGDVVSLKEWELSVVQDGKKEDTSLVVFPDVSVPAEGLLLITNSDPTADGNLLAGGDDITTAKAEVKGSSHLYLVNAGLSLPDNGQFLLILRNATEKLGLNEAFVDVAGGGGSGTDAFVREQEGDYDTYVWPLQVLEAPGSATEDALSSGKVWLRAKADIVGYHRDAWAEAAFTGVGYDRKVSKSAETAGTPGYPNGAVKTEAPTPRGAITISEVMLDSAGGTLPQWVELYNASKTDALNINRWELEIQNVADSEDLVGRPVVRLTLQEKIIQPNQTLLIVTGNARASSADVYPEDRVYNLLELHDKNLRIKKPSDTFLSAKGFYLRLTDRNEHLVDEVGNTDGDRRTDDTPAWALPVPLSEVEGMRSSLIRRYDKGVARDGKEKSSWALAANFAKFKAGELHYGHADDIGTPGYRQGGALPVELSSFTVTRVASGSVIVTWTTESEVDNAGFNLRRSLTRDGGYTLLNPALIAGAGTTGERQTYTFIDTSAKPGVEHYYQIEEVSFGGKAETLVTRRLRGPVSPAHRALKTLGEVKQAK